VLRHLPVLAVRHEALHIALEVHLPVDLDLLVIPHALRVSHHWAVHADCSVRSPRPAYKALEFLWQRMIEVRPKIEGGPAI